MVRLCFPKLDWRYWLLLVAIGGWLSGFWWCRGRWEQGQWFLWIVLPVFALNADRVWELWKEWYHEKSLIWLGLFALMEWQFWIAGLRAGDWWGGSGSGKDFVTMAVLLSLLSLAGREGVLRKWLLEGSFWIASLAVLVSLALFYRDYGLSEERFRLVWRYAPGFNAVTTGVLIGFGLLLGLQREEKPRWWHLIALAVLGFALAGSESRGALLAVMAGTLVAVGQVLAIQGKTALRLPLAFQLGSALLGFGLYWIGATVLGEDSGGMVARGSAGRWEIYQEYLSRMSLWDWVVGKGEVPLLGKEVLGWVVHHPHSAYLGQLVGFGVFGLLGLIALLAKSCWDLRRSTFLPFLVFGLFACLFDGGLIFSAFSLARWEVLVVAVPLALGLSVKG